MIPGTASDEWHPGPGVEWIDRSRVVYELHAHEGGPPDPAQEAADPFLPQTCPERSAAGEQRPPVGAAEPAARHRQCRRASGQHGPDRAQQATAALAST
jgi:hypothetical protein